MLPMTTLVGFARYGGLVFTSSCTNKDAHLWVGVGLWLLDTTRRGSATVPHTGVGWSIVSMTEVEPG